MNWPLESPSPCGHSLFPGESECGVCGRRLTVHETQEQCGRELRHVGDLVAEWLVRTLGRRP